MQRSDKETNTISDGHSADNYPTNHSPSDHTLSDQMKDSSRYSRPDKRPDRNGPGGES